MEKKSIPTLAKSSSETTLPEVDTSSTGELVHIPKKLEQANDISNSNYTHSLGAWFLGERGENGDQFKKLANSIFDRIQLFRQYAGQYGLEDRTRVETEHFRDTFRLMEQELTELCRFLCHRSINYSSTRYQGHMLYDVTLPGVLGFLSAVFLNQNNVCFEASPALTPLELAVCDHLCTMVGFPLETENSIRPWGHLTSGGTTANIESFWIARNLRFYGLALRDAYDIVSKAYPMADWKQITVTLANGQIKHITETSTWELLNCLPNELLSVPNKIHSLSYAHGKQIPRSEIDAAIANNSVQHLGLLGLWAKHKFQGQPVCFAPGTKHYSLKKSMAILGLGDQQCIDVQVDSYGRMRVEDLQKKLEDCLKTQTPVLCVVCVVGSTEESSVDPVAQVIELRKEYRKKGLEFHIHVDAAYGGFFQAVLREDWTLGNATAEEPSEITKVPSLPQDQTCLSKYVHEQLEAAKHADSFTVDPHKLGYVHYALGAILFRDWRYRTLCSFEAPYIFHEHGKPLPNLGHYGVEGSRASSMVAALYLSHRVIRPSKSGYGKLLTHSMVGAKKFYGMLMEIDKEGFWCVPTSFLPEEVKDGKLILSDKELISLRDSYCQKLRDWDPKIPNQFQEVGPDLNIVCYCFNFKVNGELNKDVPLLLLFNQRIATKLALIMPGFSGNEAKFVCTSTSVDVTSYGTEFLSTFLCRLCRVTDTTQLKNYKTTGLKLTMLRSVIMSPKLYEGDQLSVLKTAISEALGTIAFEMVAYAAESNSLVYKPVL